MSDHDDGSAEPRHRTSGPPREDGPGLPGRHLRLVTDENGWDACACPPGYHEYGTHAPGQRPPGTAVAVPPGAYPVEDLAAMSPSAAEMLLHRASLEAQAVATSWPHLVITRDTATGVLTYSGPFDSGLEALQRAHDFVEKYRDLEPRWDFTVTVAPLLPS